MTIKRNENWLPNVFTNLLDGALSLKENATMPSLNIIETETEFKVEIATPGMKKEDFDIRLDEDENVVISMGKKECEQEEKKEETDEVHYIRHEFSYTARKQKLLLPENVDKSKISAKVEDGVLRIELPKIAEESIKKAQRLIDVQ